MVLESLINPYQAKKSPTSLFLLGLLYSTFAVLLSLTIFPEDPSLTIVFLTVMGALPLFVNTIKSEQRKDYRRVPLIKEHTDIFLVFLFLFLGILFGYIFWDSILPNQLFMVQEKTIESINNEFSSQIAFTGSAINLKAFSIILLNNIKVLAFCFLFSFLYGSGALYILTWNASVIATAISQLIQSEMIALAPSLINYFKAINVGLGSYLIHGIPEILSYFIAAVAGGIISAAVIRHDYKSKEFKNTLIDSIDLIAMSLIVLLVAGFIEIII